MSRLTRAVAVTALPPDQQASANTTIRAIVDQTDFPLRAQRIAAEIAARRPDLVSLQETALWRHGPLDGSPATVVDYDFLGLLLNALAARGQRDEAVDAQQESDVSGSAFLNGTLQDVRLTMRDVVLKRAHDGVRVLSATGANYVARIPLMIAGQSLAFIRGYDALAWVVGKDPAERTPPTPIGRLWPSDHAGVVVRLRP